MNSKQSSSFSGFLFAFIGIVLLAFGVLVWAGQTHPEPVDNVALPQ